ncbi:MAG: DUF3347 domain-containing protein [Chitinophagaceae bacterium]
MIKRLLTGAMMLAIVIFYSCGEQKQHEQHAQSKDSNVHESMQHMDTVAVVETVILKDDRLNAVYRQYVQLTNALIGDDLKNAKIAGNAIAAGMTDVTGGGAVKNAAIKITEASDIGSLRIAYAGLNAALIEQVKKSGLSSGALYVDFCPMALDDKGAYWLSAQRDIRNPYMGAQMLTCGEVKDSIR